ncbi:molecular chaperone HtpG [Entomobacter blattae]|uniref:Chaperone protein HtpG n=1 Tax=Entomobacter blattae TaxID=2762277 RepID=A0A7H1NRB4_9PROT|nr:molecular chaperone HtpG [Entomobacter blattae]QNT78324.1 Chaperone protein HtpG [Entomobacter blattae]
MTETSSSTVEERHEFSAEVGRLLDLVVHALYSEREIFLRELVANAADATDRRRFEALTEAALALPEKAGIHIHIDKDKRLLSISDDGIGMTREELARNLGTIARSGTRAFGEQLQNSKPEERPSLIGQFGVGFYAAFMVADKVDVISRHAGTEEAWQWSSEGKGEYSISPAQREKPGTSITLHIKADADEFLEVSRLETIIRKWADNIAWPITVHDGEKESTANQGTALWRKPKSELTQEQLTEFYRHTFHMFDDPWATLHWHAEGTLEFTALLFIPSMRPMFEPMDATRDSKVRLHVKRMFITDEGNILPPWLRFVQGVVDTEDLPLNVSREMLQTTPVLNRIRKAVTNRVLTELKSRAKNDEASYLKFWENFGAQIKEGIWDNSDHRMELAELSRFHSTTTQEQALKAIPAEGQKAENADKGSENNPANQEKAQEAQDKTQKEAQEETQEKIRENVQDKALTTLEDYISRMKDKQEAIYYIAGDSLKTLSYSPHLEGFKAQGIEVLLLIDPVDSFWPERLGSYKDKPLRNITQAQDDLSKLAGKTESEEAKTPAEMEKLVTSLKEALKDKVSEVKGTHRLVESAVVVAPAAFGPDLQMQRLMRRSGQEMPEIPPILELNFQHPLIKALAEQVEKGENIAETSLILLDLARIQEGDAPSDPPSFARRVLVALTEQQTKK